jgi:hypothetical protein
MPSAATGQTAAAQAFVLMANLVFGGCPWRSAWTS